MIDLRVLSSRYAWDTLAITRFLKAAKLDPDGSAEISFAPPSTVVAVVPMDEPALLLRSRAWLDDAARVLILRERDGSIAESDPELEEVIEAEWSEALGQLAVPSVCADWRSDADLPAIIQRALDLAHERAPIAEGEGPGLPPITEHQPGPLIPIELPSWMSLQRAIASRLLPSRDSVLLYTRDGAIDLRRHTLAVCLSDDDMIQAVTPGGAPLYLGARNRWRIGSDQFEAYGNLALGFDGCHPVGWTGHRMMVYWLYSGRRGIGFLSASDHDYPCGPAKKLYGYEDNHPVRVSLSPNLDLVAYHFEHDVLITSAMPISWRIAGAVQVADFARDPSRTVFFARTPRAYPTEDMLDEDAREAAPCLVLGPTATARYAVDLSDSVYRIASLEPFHGSAARIGGPAREFAVFSAGHEQVRRASGRLLGGWWRWATVVDGGSYWREDLATGERYPLGKVEWEPLFAVGVPYTRNVVLVVADGDRRRLSLI